MGTKDYIQHFKFEVPLLLSLIGFGCTAALAKQARKKVQPKVDEILASK